MGVKHRQCPRCLACEDCGGCCCWMLDEDGEISADTVWPTQHGGLDVSAEVVVLNERKAMKPSPGRIVHYRLSASDCEAINKRRADFEHSRRQFSDEPLEFTEGGALLPPRVRRPDDTGFQGHVGNEAREGDYYPAVVVRVFGEYPDSPVNLKVLLDGNDDFWATSRYEGEGPGTWTWPPREGQ